MDLDTLHLHVSGLLAFKKRVEELLDQPAVDQTSTEELSKRIDDLSAQAQQTSSEAMNSAAVLEELQKFRVDAAAKLASVDDMLSWFGTNKDAIEVLLSMGDDFQGQSGAPGGEPMPEPEAPADQAPADPAPQPSDNAPAA